MPVVDNSYRKNYLRSVINREMNGEHFDLFVGICRNLQPIASKSNLFLMISATYLL